MRQGSFPWRSVDKERDNDYMRALNAYEQHRARAEERAAKVKREYENWKNALNR